MCDGPKGIRAIDQLQERAGAFSGVRLAWLSMKPAFGFHKSNLGILKAKEMRFSHE